MPQRVPISPQCRMNFCATGVSVAFVVSVISVVSLYTEYTAATAICQALSGTRSSLQPQAIAFGALLTRVAAAERAAPERRERFDLLVPGLATEAKAYFSASAGSGDDNEAPAAGCWVKPNLLDFGERHTFGFDLKRAFCGPVHHLLHRGNKNVARGDSGRSENGQRSASEHRGGKRDGWACAFAHLDEARLCIYRGKFGTGDGGQKNFGGPPPNVINYNVESTVGSFLRECLPQIIIRLVEMNGCIRSELEQFLQSLRVSSGGNHAARAEQFCNLHGQLPCYAGGTKDEHGLVFCDLCALAEH